MKKILTIIMLTIFVLSCDRKVTELEIIESDKPIVLTEKTPIKVASKKPLKHIGRNDILEIYVRADGAPGMFLNSRGELKGFYVDLEKEVMKVMNQKYNLNPYFDVGLVIPKIKSGEAHIALSVPDLHDYRSFLNLSNNYEEIDYVTIVQNDNNDIIPKEREELIKSFSGKKIGVQTRGHIYQVLREYKDIDIVEYGTTTLALEALSRGELYAVPEVKRIMEYYSKLNNWNLKAVGKAICSLKITTGFSQILDPSVIDRYNVALQSLIDSGYVKKLYNSYFGITKKS